MKTFSRRGKCLNHLKDKPSDEMLKSRVRHSFISSAWLSALWDKATGRDKLKERLSHATGALADIQILVTSCVPRSADPKLHEISRAVLNRILSSAHATIRKPGWYIHEWEKDEFEQYFNGGTNACASNISAFEEAKRLCI